MEEGERERHKGCGEERVRERKKEREIETALRGGLRFSLRREVSVPQPLPQNAPGNADTRRFRTSLIAPPAPLAISTRDHTSRASGRVPRTRHCRNGRFKALCGYLCHVPRTREELRFDDISGIASHFAEIHTCFHMCLYYA